MNTALPTPLRNCLREPIAEIEASAQLLSAAVDRHITGDRTEAARLIQKANSPIVRAWTESLWGKGSPYVPSGPYSEDPPFGRGAAGRVPSLADQSQLHLRDGYYRRFCGIPVIRKEVRERIRKLYPDVQIWGRKNTEQHAALQCMWAQYDHLIPHSRRGPNTVLNLVVTCAPCNYGRMQYTLAEARLANPLERSARRGLWDGLERIFALPAASA